jgi:hypothetical protein
VDPLEEDEAFVDPQGDRYTFDDGEAWESAAAVNGSIRDGYSVGSAAAGRGRNGSNGGNRNQEAAAHGRAATGEGDSEDEPDVTDLTVAADAPLQRSSLVNKLFVQKPAPARQTPVRKGAVPGDKAGEGAGAGVRGGSEVAREGGGVVEVKEAGGGEAALAGKMAELDKEVREFRRQNELLDRLRQELDAERVQVQRDRKRDHRQEERQYKKRDNTRRETIQEERQYKKRDNSACRCREKEERQ